MRLLAGISAIGWTDPISFIVGVIVGLGLSSRWQIIRRKQPSDDDP